jgi:hypothetical protein
VLGQFENGTAMLRPRRAATSSRHLDHAHRAASSTALGLRIPNGRSGLDLPHRRRFDVATGTIEMWVQPGSAHLSRAELFSLRGARSLDGDGFNELLVGEATTTPTTTLSRLYFNHGAGSSSASRRSSRRSRRAAWRPATSTATASPTSSCA